MKATHQLFAGIVTAAMALSIVACAPRKPRITETDGVYTLTQGDLSLSVSAVAGGKVTSFKRAGKEMLVQADVHPKYYGAVLWTSPQRDYWPISPTLDNGHYHAGVTGRGVTLASEKDTLTGFRFIKEFSISEDETVHINYTVENISDGIRYAAPWDVARVHGGISFFPLKDMDLPGLSSDLAHTSIEDGILWYNYMQEPLKRGQKLFATTREGWLAHYRDGLLFIKRFPTVDKQDLPALQGEVEIFVAPNSAYVELENHGKYTTLQPGEALSYREEWRLVEAGKGKINKDSLLELTR